MLSFPNRARRLTGGLGSRLTPYRLALLGLLVLVLAFYMWTAASSLPFSFSSSNNDVYNELTTAFLHGHTYLPITPPAGLLRLSDPYNPALNARWNGTYHDLSLYHGRFYSQWGPTPVVTLFLPFRITGYRMSESFAVALFAFIGLTCAILLLHALVRRLVPRTPSWVLFVSSIGLAFGNTLPFLLRRPIQYEVAISSGYCFEMAGLLLIVTAVLGPNVRRWRMAFGSLCLGLAIGGRPTLVVGGCVAFAAALWAIRRRGERHSLFAYALAPFVVVGILLALYNQVRFGAFTNFGESYELSGIDELKAAFYRLSYIFPGLFSYLLIPARLALTFPYAFLQTAAASPFSLPNGYAGTSALAAEPAGGLLTVTPIALLLLGLPLLWRRHRAEERRPLVAASGLVALGLLIATVVSWALFGTTERYEVDFATLFLIPAFLVWAMLVARQPPGAVRRRIVAVVGVIFTLFGSAVGIGVSFTGYQNLLLLTHPNVFRTLEDVTSPLPTLATIIGDKPVLARVDNGPLPVALPPANYATVTESDASAYLGTEPITLTVISPGPRQLKLAATVSPGTKAPPLSAMTIDISSPGHKPVQVPLVGSDTRLPLDVHLGLNRIRLTLAGTPTSQGELLVSNMYIVR